jgi:hypothetical protein
MDRSVPHIWGETEEGYQSRVDAHTAYSKRPTSRQMLGIRPDDLDERESELWEKLSVLYEEYCGRDETVWPDRMASFEAVEGPLFRPIRQHMNLGRTKAMLAIKRSGNNSAE